MRYLGIGDTNDLAAMYLGLAQRGHEVRVFVRDPAYRGVFKGLLSFTDNWQHQLGWIREAGPQGFVLFESAGDGATQDALRADGFQVIGGSAWGDKLEGDREFGQSAFRSVGLQTAASHTFRSYETASDFVRQHPGRYVLKLNGAHAQRTSNFIGMMDDGQDVIALLEHYRKTALPHPTAAGSEGVHFVLMEHVQGVEVGVGAYFNGEAFLSPACIDFEHKRFFPGDLGELTGEMGTIVSYRFSQRLFDAVMAPLASMLREGRYCGYINVNLLVNEDGLWPLEFTSRFGYPGFAICEALHSEPWESIFATLASKHGRSVGTRGGFAAGVALTVPPFPYPFGYETLSKGLPICLRSPAPPAGTTLRFAEVAIHHGQLVTSGATGYVGVATGLGSTPASANAQALRAARTVVVPNLRYREDIGDRLGHGGEWDRLGRLGWIHGWRENQLVGDSPRTQALHPDARALTK